MDLADRMRLPYAILEPLLEHLRVEMLVQVKSALGMGTRRLSIHADRRRPRSRASLFRRVRLRRARAGSARPVHAPHERAARADARRLSRARRRRLLASHRRARNARPARSGHRVAARRCSSTARPETARASWAKASARVLGGDIYVPHAIDVDGQIITMFDPVAHESRTDEDERSIIRSDERHRRPLDAGEPAGHHRRRRADARNARPSLQGAVGVLRGARAPEGERRRAGRRRLRPPARAGARSAEPLDRAARIARRLPEPAYRPEVPGAVRRDGGVRHEPRAAIARRRSVSATHSLQDSREEPVARAVLPHLGDELPAPRRARSTRRSCSTCTTSTTSDGSSRCARATRAISPTRSSTCAGITGGPPEITTDLLDEVCQTYFLEDTQTGMTAAR